LRTTYFLVCFFPIGRVPAFEYEGLRLGKMMMELPPNKIRHKNRSTMTVTMNIYEYL